MKFFLLKIVLTIASFIFSSFGGFTHASEADHVCSSYQLNQNLDDKNKPLHSHHDNLSCDSEKDQHPCESCCCNHSYSVINFDVSHIMAVDQPRDFFQLLGNSPKIIHIADISRPPRF